MAQASYGGAGSAAGGPGGLRSDYSFFMNSAGSVRQATGQGASLDQFDADEGSWVSALVPSKQTLGVMAAIGLGLTLIGGTTYLIATRIVKRQRASQLRDQLDREEAAQGQGYLSDEDDLNVRLAAHLRKRRGGPAQRPPPLITFAELFEQALFLQSAKQAQRKVKIYFDSNDEFVAEEQIPELYGSAVSTRSEHNETQEETESRLMETVAHRYRPVHVYFGNEDLVHTGTTKITRNIFAGTQDKTENAMLFLENMTKVKQSQTAQLDSSGAFKRKVSRDHDGLMSQASQVTQLDAAEQVSTASERRRLAAVYNSDSGFESLDPIYEDGNSIDDDEVLLNISPNKFEKPKDQLYMDFFVKYTEVFLNDSKSRSGSDSARGGAATKTPLSSGAPVASRQASGQRLKLCTTETGSRRTRRAMNVN